MRQTFKLPRATRTHHNTRTPQQSRPAQQTAQPSTATTLATVAAVAGLLLGCRPGVLGNASPSETFSQGSFRWTITRLRGATPTLGVQWLDNKTILFIGISDSTNISGLYAWDRKSPARLVLANAYRVCFDGKTWSARTMEPQPGKDAAAARRYKLNPGDLSTTQLTLDDTGPMNGVPNPYTCKIEKHPTALIGHYWKSLLPWDGYLDLGVIGQTNQEAHLLLPDSKTRIPLEKWTIDPSSQRVKFSRFTNTYIAYDYILTPDLLKQWERDGGLSVYVLSADGKRSLASVRSGPWSLPFGGDREIDITQNGMLISSKGGGQFRSSPAGLYLIRKRDHIKLDSGYTQMISVSPNGCGVGYSKSGQGPTASLQATNVCTPPP